MSLTFKPLYWVYHDFWKYQSNVYYPVKGGNKTATSNFNHLGHIHFFIPGFYTEQENSYKAYSGTQTYNFSLDEIWSPNSTDVNQQHNFTIVGKPIWYFYIEQYWRRIYIQNWQYKNNSSKSGFLGKKGIKYDASLPQHTKGIYRQTKSNYFFYTDLCRTLPIEYWKNSNKTIRDHYLRLNNNTQQYLAFYDKLNSDTWSRGVDDIASPTWDFQNDYPILNNPNIYPTYDVQNNLIQYTDFYDHYDEFTIPRGEIVDSVANYAATQINKQTGHPPREYYYQAYGDQSGARITSYPDRYYIYPTIEYQKVIHKNYQRLDGWQDRDIDDFQTGTHFGDGYQYTISIPYTRTINGKTTIQSPFSDDNGVVQPAGTYCHNVVPQQQQLKYNLTYDTNGQPKMNNYQLQFMYNKARTTWHYPMPQDLAQYDGNEMFFTKWNCPSLYSNYLDGMWVQQCLGAIVKAKVDVITQDNYGGRTTHTIQTNTYQNTESFVGKDQ